MLKSYAAGADLGRGCRGSAPPPPRDDLRFSNTTGILRKKKKTMWFISVEVEKETSAPPPKKNLGSAPAQHHIFDRDQTFFVNARSAFCIGRSFFTNHLF